MKEIPQEKVIEKFESLPEPLQDLILGDKLSGFVAKAALQNNLNDEKTKILATLVGDFIMGFSNEQEFIKDAQIDLGISVASAGSIISELNTNLLSPIIGNTKKSEDLLVRKQEEVPPLRPISAPPPIIPQKQQEPPILKTKEESKSLPQAPLILHQEEELEPHKEFVSPAPQRPLFYKPTFKGVDQISQIQPTARLELGEETKIAQSRTERTPSQPSRIVHYSEFRTLLNPSDNNQPPSRKEQPEQLPPKEKIEAEEKPAVHPNNVVDLKDLPLE